MLVVVVVVVERVVGLGGEAAFLGLGNDFGETGEGDSIGESWSESWEASSAV